jgi:hypothetical protein
LSTTHPNSPLFSPSSNFLIADVDVHE